MFGYKGVAKIGNRELIGDLVRRNGKYYILPINDCQRAGIELEFKEQ